MKLKTKSLYIGYYDDENESSGNWHTFIASNSLSDEELKRHFRNVVYKGEYGIKLDKNTHLDVYELRESFDYSRRKHYKITV